MPLMEVINGIPYDRGVLAWLEIGVPSPTSGGMKILRISTAAFAVAVLVATIGAPGTAWAACTDPAQPEVNWRRCYFDGRDLAGGKLRGAMLRDATFQRANLKGADLSHADAYRAKFVSADMPGVILDGARLIEADLTRAHLDGASLKEADLRNAQLSNASMRQVDLTGAQLTGANLRNADLSGATWTDGQKICAEGSRGQCN
jgi:hypothetical protein